jgi:hypothetical protein
MFRFTVTLLSMRQQPPAALENDDERHSWPRVVHRYCTAAIVLLYVNWNSIPCALFTLLCFSTIILRGTKELR